jgi:hypothetical protein
MTGSPLPRTASCAKAGGASTVWKTALNSRASVAVDTEASEDGQLANRLARVTTLFQFAFAHGKGAKTQGIELDEAGSILLVICALVVLECDQALIVKRIW